MAKRVWHWRNNQIPLQLRRVTNSRKKVFMAKRGRPSKNVNEQTEPVRVRKDLAVMLRWIARIQDVQVSEFVDPQLRPVIIAKYALLLPSIRSIKEAEDAARKAAGQPPTDPLPEVVIVEVPTAPPVESEKKPKKKT